MALVSQLPQTLLHSDFNSKKLVLRQRPREMEREVGVSRARSGLRIDLEEIFYRRGGEVKQMKMEVVVVLDYW